MTATDDHADLRAAWQAVADAIDGLPGRLTWGDTAYMDLTEKAERARSLVGYLRAAVSVSDNSHLYGPALALVRSALEHMVMDWLVVSGRTYVRRFRGVSEGKWRQWEQERTEGAGWATHLRTMSRTRKGDVTMVFDGMYSTAEDGTKPRQISIYYFLMDEYQPGLGPASAQEDDGVVDLAHLRKTASENEAIWRVYLTWGSPLANLRENHLVDEVDAGRLQTHYRFLSGFGHPITDTRRGLYGNVGMQGAPTFDHFSSELVLLYAVHVGIAEVRHLLDVLDPAEVTVSGETALRATLDHAEAIAKHFWFMGCNPHSYDIWTARNRAAMAASRETRTISTPPAVEPVDVPFPSNPLTRLVRMHSSAVEMISGLAFDSPWPHPDARWRP